jgi:hypothetical protein
MVGPQPFFFWVFCNNFPQFVIFNFFSKMQRFSGHLAFSDCEISKEIFLKKKLQSLYQVFVGVAKHIKGCLNISTFKKTFIAKLSYG